MSTRARIGVEQVDGTVRSIYTHSDGYPSHHGPLLLGPYGHREAAEALLALGDLSVLGPTIGEKADPSKRPLQQPAEQCYAYGRDLDYGSRPAVTHRDIDAFVEACDALSFAYLLTIIDEWECLQMSSGQTWKRLKRLARAA